VRALGPHQTDARGRSPLGILIPRPQGGFFMSSISPAQDFADKVGGIATCHLLGAGTSVAATVAASSVYTGQVWGVVGGGAATAAFAALGVASGCYNNPGTPESAKPPLGCTKTDNPTSIRWIKTDGSGQGNSIANGAVQIIDVVADKDSFNYDIWSVVYIDDLGSTKVRPGPRQNQAPLQIFLYTDDDGVNCLEQGDPNPDISPPLDYTDEETGCQWSIAAKDTFIGKDGLPHVYWVATASDPACGGPFTWWDSPTDGPQPVGPNPVDPDKDPAPPDVPQPGLDYSDDFTDIKERLDRIEQCACGNEKPTLDGEWISTRWVSDSPSPAGTKPLRKLFRYRSKSTRDHNELQAYWSAFVWQAGSVCVIHKGAWWGTPQVWASSADEGKRVIRFAAGEAGIDPDQVGEWLTSNASSPRYGMSGRMRLAEEQGEQWVTRREGPSGLPAL